ncbi:MAG: prolipoprotein diacylglyceryl transferase [Desulfobulbaceae bacterium]|nr:prolipoprotein diacylglyceryl transferase [Desulfobulbaceae bacterium]
MLEIPTINPVLFSLGPLQIRWYGLMYVIGFTAAYLLVVHQAKKFVWDRILHKIDDLNLALIIGVIIGGRLGYVFFYNPAHYLSNPIEILAIWSGGMSFHGGCLGALMAGLIYCRRTGLNFWKAADLFVVTVPVGLFFGRLGNFINGELYGRPTEVSWGMIFPGGGPLPRHPSQLYEATLEGIVLFAILWTLKAKPWQQPYSRSWPHGTMLALFLTLYGLFRFLIEFFRQPDPQIGLLFLDFSMGQILCLTMIGAGILLWFVRKTAPMKEFPSKKHNFSHLR